MRQEIRDVVDVRGIQARAQMTCLNDRSLRRHDPDQVLRVTALQKNSAGRISAP